MKIIYSQTTDLLKNFLNYLPLILLFIIISSDQVSGQYFGRNKPNYTTFEFKVYQTPNFEIYHYLENDSLIKRIGESAELWYNAHQSIFKDTFENRNPIIFYANHADFQQTTTISSHIGVGTGGVTESLKNRVVMPFFDSYQETNHVLGHELVHAFQYKHLFSEDPGRQKSIRNLPLWMVEGMAEYLSIGSEDSHTSMWMRDAVINDDFPSLDDLTRSSKYFPYRFGQAFWAFVAKMWGDSIVMPLFDYTTRYGYQLAIDSVLNINAKTLSNMWKSATYVHYKKFLNDSVAEMVGENIISKENAGDINIAPSISPDGKRVAFFSEKDVFTLDLYLADAETGRIIRRLANTVRNNDIDAISFIESAPAWSPDGSRLAYVVYSKGINQLVVANARNGRVIMQKEVAGVPAFSNPSWSPDGNRVLLSGRVNGLSNLYIFNIETGAVEQITNDDFAAMQPQWAPDGQSIVFVTDKPQENQEIGLYKNSFNLAIYNFEQNRYEVVHVFPGADNLHPAFTSDSESVLFLSDRDGFRNLYRYYIESGKVFKLTSYPTGITGISAMSPALTVSRNTNTVAYSYFFNRNYVIYQATLTEFDEIEIAPTNVDLTAGTLPPLQRFGSDIVDHTLAMVEAPVEVPVDSFNYVPFRRNFKLDYIGNTSMGVATSRYGTGMAGSVAMLFSDIVGEYQLFSGIALNGEIYDFGGQVAFINQKNRINWGASLSHIPFRYGLYGIAEDTLNVGDGELPVLNQYFDVFRMFQDRVSVFAYYPFTHTQRIEAGAAMSWYYYRIDRFNYYYDYTGLYYGQSVDRNLPSPDGFNIQQIDLAYVTDNSHFGMTSPLRGHRSRFQAEKYFGAADFYTLLADFRNYTYVKPFSFAIRLMHYGRYGSGSDAGILSPLFIGYPWMIRGYDTNSFGSSAMMETNVASANQLIGTRMAIANLEVRLPFTGPEKISIISSNFILTELALFMDGGLAWDSDNEPVLKWETSVGTERVPVFSAGLSLRVNLFGYMVIEPFYAIPFQRSDVNPGVFGFNFLPGW